MTTLQLVSGLGAVLFDLVQFVFICIIFIAVMDTNLRVSGRRDKCSKK